MRMDISSTSYLKLCKELTSPTMNLDDIALIINCDAHLTYKLLQRMKTIQYYRGNNIKSIKHALVMMGNEEVRRWIMLILIRGIVHVRSDELIRTALIRALMCEKLARESGSQQYAYSAFSTGMFSILIANKELNTENLKDINLPKDILDALTGSDNILKRILDICVCYEQGQWNKLEYIVSYTVSNIDQSILPGLYLESVTSADEMFDKENNL